jgi:ATP-dependent DNA helicase RecG
LAQRVVAALQDGPASKAELARRFGQQKVSGQLNKVIRDLLASGTIAHTLPDKPNSRLQKYRLIARP